MIRTLSRQDVTDILVGSTVFGAGGGGELEEGLELIDRAIAAGKQFRMSDLSDVDDDDVLCTPYLLGAVSDLPSIQDTLIDGIKPPILVAFERLATYLRAPVVGCVPCELGGSNTAVPFFVTAMAGGVVIDADPAGRAVPLRRHGRWRRTLDLSTASPLGAWRSQRPPRLA